MIKRIIVLLIIFMSVFNSIAYATEVDILNTARIEVVPTDDLRIKNRILNYYKINDTTTDSLEYSIQDKEVIENTTRDLLTTFDSLNIDVSKLYPYGLKMYVVPYISDNVAAFVTYNYDTDMDVYFLKTYSYQSKEKDTILYTLHELGHTIDKIYFTYEEREEYKRIRKIDSSKSWYGDSSTKWHDIVAESFAEDFATIFNTNICSNRTNYGDASTENREKVKNLIMNAIKRKIEKR